MKYKSRQENVHKKEEEWGNTARIINLERVGIPKDIFQNKYHKLQVIAQSNPFYKVRKVVKNRTRDTQK